MTTTPETTWDLRLDLEKLRDSGDLTDDSYHQCLMSLAADLMIRFGDADKSLRLLNMCQPSYFDVVFVQQCEYDAAFADKMLEFTYALSKLGLYGEVVEPNMSSAEA